MRIPRVQFTIGRLMLLVLVSALGLGGAIYVRHAQDRRIAEARAEAAYKQARLVREVAEYALKEYREGIYLQDKATIQGQIAGAEADRDRAIDRLKWSEKMLERDQQLTARTRNAFLLSKQKADFEVEQARTELEILENYTRQKQIKSLTSDVEKARADERARLSALNLERARRWWASGR